ncbi:hypothetical protein PANDA_013854 [Ailuropoda melanoleuca]|uniref:Uncharacterized protein n=1 Tax=Ailuropoda melanoleuca TaxID=9646 RepID=D2HPV5_AILME|nr:hypothetical protein PANDA_013854 [Ailuropoda melanoleuca]
MWVLALGGVFLATAQGCVLCHLPARDLSGRLAQLCSQVEVLWKNCGASWSFPAFALALCAPACRGSTILYNCSTCQEFKASHSLSPLRSRYHLEAKRTSEDTDNLLAAGSRDYEPITSTSSEGISQPLSSSPKGSGFQSPSPEPSDYRPQSPNGAIGLSSPLSSATPSWATPVFAKFHTADDLLSGVK